MIGGGVPKNFAQDTVICAEILEKPVNMHKYAVQITRSWGKVDAGHEQMVYAEATSVLPLIASYVYHKRDWESRTPRRLAAVFDG